jgi:hypothetical protein
MPSPESENGVAAALRSVSEHAVALARLEVRLAREEMRRKAASLGAAAGLGLAGGIFALFALGFGLAAGAVGLDAVLPLWLALLVMGAALLALSGVLVLLAAQAARRGTPPVPEQALDEAKQTKRAL